MIMNEHEPLKVTFRDLKIFATTLNEEFEKEGIQAVMTVKRDFAVAKEEIKSYLAVNWVSKEGEGKYLAIKL